ncbi:hemolysin family protein [Occallatibacter riparius]|uniref:Hemolysin family protein n=1 Tax=Occallatibacter riparius TaxID=1002689 RepID=A0A9J7BKH7_9BACT|nr:hemolysin family protein [Occallatibacter riparius]UWZ82945.1 hemolysin family protein [Occallatibacter riparius]
MHGPVLLQCVAVAMLIVANGFFVAAEFALVSVRDTRIQQLIDAHVPGARAVRKLQHDLDDFLPAVQLGVTLCSLALGWIGEPLAADAFQALFAMLPHPMAHPHLVAHALSLVAVALGFCAITYFHVVAGELVPKSLALRRAEALAVAVATPMLFFMRMARPAVRLLSRSAGVVLRGFDIPMTERASVHSPEELKLLATAARRMGVLPKFQETLVHRALELNDVPVREIMTPRQKIFSLPSSMLIEDAAAKVIELLHSRVPVYDEARGPEHIVGVVYSKDLSRLMFFRRGAAPFVQLRLSQIMREVSVVPETKSALDLLREFQKKRRHLAIVVDEYGSTVGLVTAEDAIEQLTGEIDDEFDDPTRPLLTSAKGVFMLDGSANLRDLETQMQWDLPRDGGVETLAGFILTRLGHIPGVGESVDYETRRLTVAEMDGRRISKVRVEPLAQDADTQKKT